VMPAVAGIAPRKEGHVVTPDGAQAYVAAGANRYTGA